MTSKQVYEATAIELSKVQAPTLKLYEFNYFFNQAIRQFVNKVYNIYDVNQQTTDDLRVLKATATLTPISYLDNLDTNVPEAVKALHKGTYYVTLPSDYLHLLNCICLYEVKQDKDCWNTGEYMVVGATKLTADSWSSIVDDVYNRPTKKRPYYYIHNQNKADTLPTNINTDKLHTMKSSDTDDAESNFARTFDFTGDSQSAIDKPAGSRHANVSEVRVEIRCGRDNTNTFELLAVLIDYVKAPQFIRLTQEQLDSDEDISQVLEFPDYVNQEIINELVNLIMRKINDPGLQAHMLMTLSIARPTGQLQQ